MDQHEREAKLACIAKLLRVKSCIRDLKDEPMLPASLQRLKIAFVQMVRLKETIKELEEMDKAKDVRGAHHQYKRYQLLYKKNYLIECIEKEFPFLESQTNLLSTRTSVLSILDDLEQATVIFIKRATKYVADKRAKENAAREREI